MRKIPLLLFFFSAISSSMSSAIPLDNWQTWVTANPFISRQVPPTVLVARCKNLNTYCVIEVDQTSGEIPVSLAGAAISIDFSGSTGAAVPAKAAYNGGIDGTGLLRGLKTDASGELQVDVLTSALPTGAATETTLSAVNGKLGSLGQKNMAGSAPVVISSDQSSIPISNLPTTVATNVGAADASTIRVSEGAKTFSTSVYRSYVSASVGTVNWVELIASTAEATNLLCITDQSGEAVELGVGAAASEARVFLLAPGFSGCIPLRIASAARVSVRAVSATASTGAITLSGLN